MILGVQESPGQKAWRATVGRSYPPPGRNTHFGTPPPRALPTSKRGRDHREEGKVPQEELRTTIGKREESTRRTKDHDRKEKECRMEERDHTHAQMAQGAGGYIFIFMYIYIYIYVT